MSNKKFSSQLRSARKQRKLSQTQLAARAGLQPSEISHFEAGRRSPSLHNLT
jgi:transcriptional regulator with XRE-family HTH domain